MFIKRKKEVYMTTSNKRYFDVGYVVCEYKIYVKVN